MFLPVIQKNVALHIILYIIREGTHQQKENQNTGYVPGYLNINSELKEKI